MASGKLLSLCMYSIYGTLYRYDLDDNPSGASFTRLVCPNKVALGTFTDNVAHTCNEFGFRIWESYTPFVSCYGNDISSHVNPFRLMVVLQAHPVLLHFIIWYPIATASMA